MPGTWYASKEHLFYFSGDYLYMSGWWPARHQKNLRRPGRKSETRYQHHSLAHSPGCTMWTALCRSLRLIWRMCRRRRFGSPAPPRRWATPASRRLRMTQCLMPPPGMFVLRARDAGSGCTTNEAFGRASWACGQRHLKARVHECERGVRGGHLGMADTRIHRHRCCPGSQPSTRRCLRCSIRGSTCRRYRCLRDQRHSPPPRNQ